MKYTFGLTMIMKDEVGDLRRILNDYSSYFDAIYLTVTDEDTYRAVIKEFGNNKKLYLSYFAWIDHFGKARIFNQKQIKTDYWMWIDLDDEVVGVEKLASKLAYMEQRKLDALLFPYHYMQNNHGETTSLQWRERIIRTASPLAWLDAAVHETVDFRGTVKCEFSEDIYIKHHKTQADLEQSELRNKPLLEKDWQERHSAQTAIYLGRHYMLDSRVDDVLEMFSYAAKNGETDDLRQQGWGYIADVYCALKQYPSALEAAQQATAIDPNMPDAWYQQVVIYMSLGQYRLAAQAADIALTKKPSKQGLKTVNPTKYTYAAQFLAAKAYLYNREVEKAYQLFTKVKKAAPHYLESQSSVSINWVEVFEEVKRNPKILDDMLPLPTKHWPKKSIAFYAHTGIKMAAWGPDTLGQGMGGSEESVVYLSRELAKLGWHVTVFCERPDSYEDKQSDMPSVTYRPWSEFNPSDTFDTFVSWRNPFQTFSIKARRILVDLHDATEEGHLMATKSGVDTFLVKSQWHRNLYPNIPDRKFAVIGNGILPQHFAKKRAKKLHSAGYFSSYDRGLETLLSLWPQIRAKVPNATLDIYYGWELFDAMHANNPDQQKVKKRMLQQLQALVSQGVTEHGRVDHEQLADAMQGIGVWLYPTEFPEIFCITALKTAEAGMQQVCTNYAALTETAPGATFINSQHIYTDKLAQEDFVEAAVEALLHPKPSKPPQGFYWPNIAKQWNKLLNE